MSLVGVFAQLLSTQASKYQDSGDPNCKTSMYIGDVIANKDSITQVDAQLITSAQQHPWPWFAAAAVIILCMWTIIDPLYFAAVLGNFSHHATMNVLNGFY